MRSSFFWDPIHGSKCSCVLFLLRRAPKKTSSWAGCWWGQGFLARVYQSCFCVMFFYSRFARPLNFVMVLGWVCFVAARRFVEYRSLAFTFWWRMLLALFSQLFTGWWWRPRLVVSLCICGPGTFWVFRQCLYTSRRRWWGWGGLNLPHEARILE